MAISRLNRLWPTLFLPLAIFAPDAVVADGFRTVALTGDPAPGTTGSVYASFIDGPVIDGEGGVAIHATTSGTGQKGVWKSTPAGLQPLMLTGQQAPGAAPGVSITTLNSSAFATGDL